MKLNTQLRRVLCGSPLHRTNGKIALAAILGALFLFALPTFVRYYTEQPLQFLAALPFGFLIYLPTILVLYWLVGATTAKRPRSCFCWIDLGDTTAASLCGAAL